MKSTAPFTSSTTHVPTSAGRRSTPTRSPSDRPGGGYGDRARLGRRRHRLAPRAERDVRPPFAGCGDAAHRADHAAARNDDAQVVAARRDELLRDGARRLVPGRASASSASARSIASWSSQRSTSWPQEPKRGLRTIGGSSSGVGSQGATCTVRGCGHARGEERLRRSRACRVRRRACGARSGPSHPRRRGDRAPRARARSRRAMGRTSSRPSATSPRPSRATACAGVRTDAEPGVRRRDAVGDDGEGAHASMVRPDASLGKRLLPARRPTDASL